MESALIVAGTDKGVSFFAEILGEFPIKQITATPSCGEGRRLLLQRDFDLIIVNAPLRDETGESFARQIAVKGLSQVILVVKSEYFDGVAAVCEADGVLVIAKPVNRAVFWAALKLAAATQNRLRHIWAENSRLKQKIEDIRIVDRAKCLLIAYLNMSEQEAHRYIEKQAMDRRLTRRAIAEGILKTYDN